jgi:calcium-dependent protein kinase
MVSRDLKPENIMLSDKDDDMTIKVIDWGTSRRFDSKKRMKRMVGTVILPIN